MSFQIIFNKMDVEKVNKGKQSYEKAVVHYSYKGESRTQTIVSFANPAVYAAVKAAQNGEILEVDTTSDGKYTNWSSVKPVDSAASSTTPKRLESKPTGSWETAEERAYKQALIVRQSCLAQAVAFSVGKDSNSIEWTQGDVLDLAQDFVDWVMQSGANSQTQE